MLDDLHAFKLKHPGCFAALDTPTRRAVARALDEMWVTDDKLVAQGYHDRSKWEDAIARLGSPNRERIIFAHAILKPHLHPEIMAKAIMLTSERRCTRCEKPFAAGCLVFKAPFQTESLPNPITCHPCMQKVARMARIHESRTAKLKKKDDGVPF